MFGFRHLARGFGAVFKGSVLAGVALVTGLSFGAPTADAQERGCRIFEHVNFAGRAYAFSGRGDAPAYGAFWNNRVSSVQVDRGCRLTAWEGRGYRGAVRIFDPGDYTNAGRGWNDRISSSRCECGPLRGGGGGGQDGFRQVDGGAIGRGSPPRLRRNGLACNFFADAGFQGPWRAYEAGRGSSLGRRLSQQVSSVELANGCVAIVDVNRQYKLYIDQDIEAFPRGINDRAVEVFCECRRR